jgi:hypothetical protein
MKRLFVKMGKLSKPTLFQLLLEKEKHIFALECLKEIGVSREEVSNIFPKPPMLQIYEYFYRGRRNFPKDLNRIWEEKENLRENVRGNTDRLEHLLLHIFLSFNFVTLNIPPLKMEAIDIVCFYPETLDLLVIGCTTGILKDDLSKMDLVARKMKGEMADLFNNCSLIPIVVTSEPVSISTSEAQFAAENSIVIMQSQHIDNLLEMLVTNRQGKEVIEYIKSGRRS